MMIIPPVTSLPQAQPASPTQGLNQSQAPNAALAAAAVTALPVGNQTRQAAVASGNTGASKEGKGDKGKKADSEANATEARTNTTGARPRGMGRRADLSV